MPKRNVSESAEPLLSDQCTPNTGQGDLIKSVTDETRKLLRSGADEAAKL